MSETDKFWLSKKYPKASNDDKSVEIVEKPFNLISSIINLIWGGKISKIITLLLISVSLILLLYYLFKPRRIVYRVVPDNIPIAQPVTVPVAVPVSAPTVPVAVPVSAPTVPVAVPVSAPTVPVSAPTVPVAVPVSAP